MGSMRIADYRCAEIVEVRPAEVDHYHYGRVCDGPITCPGWLSPGPGVLASGTATAVLRPPPEGFRILTTPSMESLRMRDRYGTRGTRVGPCRYAFYVRTA